MTGPAPVERAWSMPRWFVTVLVLFCLQAGLTWWLSDRAPLLVREESRRLRVQLMPDVTGTDLEQLLKLSNPTLFVLPGRDGFSGHAWLEVRPLRHRSPGWSNPPQWLQLKPDQLLTDFRQFVATNQPERSALSQRLSLPTEPRIAVREPDLPKPGTRMRITGQLSASDLVEQPGLPTVEYPGLLAATVVSIWVDQRGRVFQASLASGGTSGSPAADQLGLELVHSMKFAIDPRISPATNSRDFDRLREARVIIHWWTHPPSATTNAAPASETVTPVQKD